MAVNDVFVLDCSQLLLQGFQLLLPHLALVLGEGLLESLELASDGGQGIVHTDNLLVNVPQRHQNTVKCLPVEFRVAVHALHLVFQLVHPFLACVVRNERSFCKVLQLRHWC